jgi:hypothetical protein
LHQNRTKLPPSILSVNVSVLRSRSPASPAKNNYAYRIARKRQPQRSKAYAASLKFLVCVGSSGDELLEDWKDKTKYESVVTTQHAVGA